MRQRTKRVVSSVDSVGVFVVLMAPPAMADEVVDTVLAMMK